MGIPIVLVMIPKWVASDPSYKATLKIVSAGGGRQIDGGTSFPHGLDVLCTREILPRLDSISDLLVCSRLEISYNLIASQAVSFGEGKVVVWGRWESVDLPGCRYS